MRNSNTISNRAVRLIVTLVVIGVGILILLGLGQQHVYILRKVDTNQLGVQKRGGQIVRIVPPGIYSDVALFAELQTYSTQAYQFSVSDVELITLGSLFPGVFSAQIIQKRLSCPFCGRNTA
jgi:hypothetical protein